MRARVDESVAVSYQLRELADLELDRSICIGAVLSLPSPLYVLGSFHLSRCMILALLLLPSFAWMFLSLLPLRQSHLLPTNSASAFFRALVPARDFLRPLT
jgi:hypothetical protein